MERVGSILYLVLSTCYDHFILHTNSGCGKRETQPVAPGVQLVTSKPSDTLGCEFEYR